jgi:hypothetical protein
MTRWRGYRSPVQRTRGHWRNKKKNSRILEEHTRHLHIGQKLSFSHSHSPTPHLPQAPLPIFSEELMYWGGAPLT